MHHELPSNLSGVLPAKDSAELDGLLDGAAHVFHETFTQHRYVCVPMETRGLVAEWDPATERLEIVLACQGVHAPRLFYAQMLGLPEDAIHIIMRDVGGSFGQKALPDPRGAGRRGGRHDPG